MKTRTEAWDRSTRRPSVLLCMALGLSLCACRAGPDYEKPDIAVAPTFQASEVLPEEATVRPTPEMLARWWDRFEDPVMTAFIDRAVVGSRTLAVARGRLREARAQWIVEHGDLFPQLDASGRYERRRSSVENSSPSLGQVNELFAPGFDAFWELDVFGGNARTSEAGRAGAEAALADFASVLVSLGSEVAQTYVSLRRVEEQLRVARRNADAQAETLRAVSVREREGLVARLDRNRASSNLMRTRAQIPVLVSNLAALRARLGTLVGLSVQQTIELLGEARPVPTAPPQAVVGTPADLLRLRPDLIAAERRLASAVARIGAAQARLYPSISLTGSIAVESNDFDTLAQTSALAWSFGPRINLPLFYRDRLRGAVEAEDARAEIELANYEQAVLLAVEEVEAALSTWREEQVRRSILTESVRVTTESVAQARSAYDEGLVPFQTLLDAERDLLDLEGQVAQSDEVIATSAITLFKAFGGGLALRDAMPTGRRADLPWERSSSVVETNPWSDRFEEQEDADR